MRAARAVFVAALLAAFALRGDVAGAQDAPWRTRHEHVPITYTIKADLVETGVGVRLVGKETVVWENASRDSVKELRFHLYPNAFRDQRSTFFVEYLRDGGETPDDMKYGEMQITAMSVLGNTLTPRFVSPDDGNPDDRTVAVVDLPQVVEPGEKVPVQIEFTVEMPRIVRRMGAHADFVMAAQWFPKLGRYLGRDSTARDVHEGWFCPQYHANNEFSADFADYDVTLRFPAEYVVGASGAPQGEDVVEATGGGKVKTRRYKAESVVDFAWTAGKRLEERRSTIVPVKADALDDPVTGQIRYLRSLGASEEDVALPSVELVLLLQPEHAEQADRYVEATRVALGLFGAWLGPYPYTRITIVDVPRNSRLRGGMEYPTLVTVMTTDGSPPESHRPEAVTVHELGHQWLMGLVASNEAEEAWLDEGINTYLSTQAMRLAYDLRGGGFHPAQDSTDILALRFAGVPLLEFPGLAAGWPDALGLPGWARPPKIEAFRIWRDLPWLSYVDSKAYGEKQDPLLPQRRAWTAVAGLDSMVKAGWTYADARSYRANAYGRPALFLNTLRKTLGAQHGADEGDRRFLRALREYARDFRFRHPTTEDFLKKFKDVTGLDPGPLADQLVRTAGTLDYSVEIRPSKAPSSADGGKKKDAVEPPKAKTTVVRVRRRGEAVVPIDLEVLRDDKKTERRRWEAKEQTREQGWRDFTFEGAVVVARLDPDGVYLQDGNLGDQTWTAKTNAQPAVKWSVRFLGWLENALVSYGRFF